MRPFITCTGIDEQCCIDDLDSLAWPGVEFGILLSAWREGHNRYPSIEFIAAAVQRLGRSAAIHICGSAAREQLRTSQIFNSLLRKVGRIQLNGAVTPEELIELAERFPEQSIITQHAWYNLDLVDVPVANHELLVDASGGRGLQPEQWESPATDKPVGFAGGLGPDNIEAQLSPIGAIARPGWWVDMESGLRTEDDWFDIHKAIACIKAAKAVQP